MKLLTDGFQNNFSPEDLERKEILADVCVACRTTLDILNDLLCFDKMENGILVVHKHEVSPLTFISDCVNMFSAQAREGGVHISHCNNDIDKDVYSTVFSLTEDDIIFIDKFKMDQVLRNLISNALKFTPRGGSVTVTSSFIPDSVSLGGLEHSDDVSSDEIPVETENSDFDSPLSGPSSMFGGLLNSPVVRDRFNCGKRYNPTDSPVRQKNITTSSHGKLLIVVKDTGCGMLEEDYLRLFNEIVQFNPEVLQAGGGSGLGLWITKGIVDLHQGEISVHSEGLGKGSSFTLKLPMERKMQIHEDVQKQEQLQVHEKIQEEEQEEEVKEQIKEKKQLPPIQSNLSEETIHGVILNSTVNCKNTESSANMEVKKISSSNLIMKSQNIVTLQKPVYHLLIVDDSPLNRKMLIKIFRVAGHICDEAEDGLIAVSKVKEKMTLTSIPYSAILMDFVMPNMDGPTATKHIRSFGYKAPIFGVTGNTLDSDINYFLQSGADKVLAKPFDINVFNRAIIEI